MNRLENVEKSLITTTKPRDCSEIYNSGERSDGVYTVYGGGAQRPLEVYCDMSTDGGGWTVFQRRMDGSEDFYRTWREYATGFGNLTREFWLGNDNIHGLTSGFKTYVLRVDLADFDGNSRYAEYSDFKVASACDKYKITSLGTYFGTAGNSMSGRPTHLGQKFTTVDQDNDEYSGSCAQLYKGGWWYKSCYRTNLNGLYLRGTSKTKEGITWFYWKGDYYSLRFTEMKIRPCG